ncbi:Hypothetical predicted protein [Octopus vulgaris]|uniref:Uncharacterized protein n=1 Tax=Octopus vulgaris TaxID=6645 RepID=A0AA36AYD1_OCTVU|nr:Hypothetical predicted protein [Octopus vulgaris]
MSIFLLSFIYFTHWTVAMLWHCHKGFSRTHQLQYSFIKLLSYGAVNKLTWLSSSDGDKHKIHTHTHTTHAHNFYLLNSFTVPKAIVEDTCPRCHAVGLNLKPHGCKGSNLTISIPVSILEK